MSFLNIKLAGKSIKFRVMLTLGLTLFIFILAYYIFFRILDKKNLLTQDIQQHEFIESTKAILQTRDDFYEKMVFTYSVFSWMGNFINHPNKEEGELTISHPQNIGIDFIQIYGLDKKLIYYDFSPGFSDTVSIVNEVFDKLYRTKELNFFQKTPEGLVQIFGSTVHNSDDVPRFTKPNGFVIFGKYWDEDYINTLNKITNCKISLWTENFSDNHSLDVGEIYFRDYRSQKIAHINISKVNPFLGNLRLLNLYFNIFFISFCFVLFFIIYSAYNYLIINPLRSIVATLSKKDNEAIKKFINRNDEFGKIAKIIGQFFKQRNELEYKVEELRNAHEELCQLNSELSQQKQEIEGQNIKLHLLNEEMHNQNEEIVAIAEGLDVANKEITESINYASFIQKAVLAPSYELSRIFPDHFIVFAPKNIVSGDFYWFKEMRNGEKILATADCTGHGLSGALLSMLGISFLNQITAQLENEEYTAATILDSLKYFFIESLHQGTEIEYVQDGMNIALCIFDKNCRKLQYATAFHTICLVRNNPATNIPELTEFKGDHIPVGIYITDDSFTNHVVDLQQDDSIYMYSDGITDQFGGPHNRKYKPSRMRNLLVGLSQVPFGEQRGRILQEFETWKGIYEQTDDVIVVGIKVP
jgi:serine phosphatase RsbU (regulator of sigma subunit)